VTTTDLHDPVAWAADVPPPPFGPADEPVADFAARARAWIAEHLPPLPDGVDNHELARRDPRGTHARRLQRLLYEAGFAGICFPRAYGGQGLSPEHQRAFTRETVGRQMPTLLNIPTLSILAPTLLDLGSEAQRRWHLPRILAGAEIWVQFLSEPTGGSDLAGVLTRADRAGDGFVLRGAKIWSSGAFRADMAMCLARTDWDVPKHRGLTMFALPVHQAGVTVEQIPMADGSAEFCQEFFDDVVVPASAVVGEVGEGWAVASRLLVHERTAMAGASPYVSGVAVGAAGGASWSDELAALARRVGRAADPRVRRLVADARVRELVQGHLVRRTGGLVAAGSWPAVAGAVPRLFAATSTERHTDAALEIAGTAAVAGEVGDPAQAHGLRYLLRQQASLGGGSNEMQRNLISERLLGMPREPTEDHDRPFSEVRHNTLPTPRR
jgi:alkylation response protein AidB-like acyl-CoA dehydrogenase